jgi:hemerythrin-like metal-binding protein
MVMSFFTWKESFNTNIPEIDFQHQHIFRVFNLLYDAVQMSKDNDSVNKLLRDMNDYSTFHFHAEEKIMGQFGYAGLESQIKEHKYYMEEMAHLSRAFDDKNDSACMSLLQFLKDWLLNHILQEDLKFAEEIRSSKPKLTLVNSDCDDRSYSINSDHRTVIESLTCPPKLVP